MVCLITCRRTAQLSEGRTVRRRFATALASCATLLGVHGVLVPPAAHATPHRVVYKVWAEYGPLTAAALGYNDADGSRAGAMNPQLPWSKDVAWTDETKHPLITVTGYNNGDGDRIYCQILVDDLVVDEDNKVEGATCSFPLDGLPRQHCERGAHGTLVGVFDQVEGDPCSRPD